MGLDYHPFWSWGLNFWDWITTHFEVEEEKFKEVEEERFERKYKFVTECLMILNAIIVKTLSKFSGP